MTLKYEQFHKYLTNKKICDFGCGYTVFDTFKKTTIYIVEQKNF